jgi:hypothetical protein
MSCDGEGVGDWRETPDGPSVLQSVLRMHLSDCV